MKYLTQKYFERLKELLASAETVYLQIKEMQENKTCFPGFDRDMFSGEIELYSDYIIGCAFSATSYKDRRLPEETAARTADYTANQCDLEKFPHIRRLLEDQTLQTCYPLTWQYIQICQEMKTLLQSAVFHTENLKTPN